MTRAAILIAIVIAMTLGPAHGQQPSAPASAPAPSSTDTQAPSIQQESPDQKAITTCSSAVPDPSRTSSATTKNAGVTEESILYTPLSPSCKFHLFVKQTYSPYTFASAGFQAAWADAVRQWPHYGVGAAGLGKRFGAVLADTESRRFIQGFALCTLLRQDPRYFPSYKKKLLARSWYAVTRVVVTRNDNDRNTANTSEFLGALVASSLQNSYYPRHDRTFHDTMSRYAGSLSSDATGDLLREFTPDLKRFFHRHAPKKVLQIENKLPIPEEDKP